MKTAKRKPAIEEREVCPMCWKPSCPLMRKFRRSRFSDEEKRKFMRDLHKRVCVKCKKLAHHSYMPCETKALESKGRIRKVLPSWWPQEVVYNPETGEGTIKERK